MKNNVIPSRYLFHLPKVAFLLCIILLLSSCGASKRKVVTKQKDDRPKTEVAHKKNKPAPAHKPAIIEPEDDRIYNIVNFALGFEGTSYQYGGTTSDGMDCSGLVYTSFLQHDLPLPRSSRDMALKGERLYLDEVSVGDLLFFETNKNRKVINHVGLVVEVGDEILFIHSTSSRGVIVSKLSEYYWTDTFVMARRII